MSDRTTAAAGGAGQAASPSNGRGALPRGTPEAGTPGPGASAGGVRPARTSSGMELPLVYGPADLAPGLPERLGEPGRYPFTRGIHATMYRGRLWTMRQYAGFGTAAETNRRFRYLLEHGQTGLSVAFDLPTQMGLDSDDPRARGEVGRTGVAISSLADMAALLDGLPLDRVSTSMTINATAAILLALYIVAAEQRGFARGALSGTIQNDILKEYIARGTYIYPPRPSMRLITDVFAWCKDNLPDWNTISISGYHMREAGCTAAQEVAFTIADAIEYVQAALDAGLGVDEFGPRLSFFFNVHNLFLEEVAKFRAARRLWARLMRERVGARDPRSWMLRFHCQTGGSTLTAQQPDNNVVRVALQALAAVFGGCQSLHTNAKDEALALPTAEAARLALRTQQIIAYESGAADLADPLGGAWAVEALTDRLEAEAQAYLDRIDALGGAVAAIEAGFVQREIQESAYRDQQAVERGERVVVGVNRYAAEEPPPAGLHRIDPGLEEARVRELTAFKAGRDRRAVEAALARLTAAARGSDNLLPPILDAVRASATLGEVAGRLRGVFGEHREIVVL